MFKNYNYCKLMLCCFLSFTIGLTAKNNPETDCPTPDTFLTGDYQIADVNTNFGPSSGTENFPAGVVTITGIGNTTTFQSAILPTFNNDVETINFILNCGIIQIEDIDPNLNCDISSYIFTSTDDANSTTYSFAGDGSSDDAGPFNFDNPDFFLTNNGQTCKCPDADYGDTGTLTINGVQKTFTKRSRADLDNLINIDINDPQIELTCTTGITDMSNLFFFTNFNQNISHWDVSNVTDMSDMFFLDTSFNQPLDNWDVSNVTDMSSMFQGENDYGSSFNQPLNNWDVSNVTVMSSMFSRATSFNQPLDNWDVSNVTDMSSMFQGENDYVSSFNQPLNTWDVSNVSVMRSMFSRATSFDQPLDNWDVSNVTDMSGMFSRATSFNQPLDNWDVSNITDMKFMFLRATSFDQPLDNWDVSNVTDMRFMFDTASSFNQPLDNWDVSNVTDMRNMFNSAISFNQPLNNWNYNQSVKLSDFISSSHLDSLNYEALLQYFENSNLSDKTLGALSVAYCNDQARNNLIDNYGWSIIGDTQGQCGQTLNPSTTPFVTTWTVDDEDPSINIYTVDFYDYDLTVDWGDGQVDQNVTSNISHTYASAGTYTVSITGVFPYFKVCNLANSTCDNAAKLSSVESWGDQEWRYMLASFSQAENFVLNTTQAPNFNNVESLRYMFKGATSFSQPINNWDVSNVKDMSEIFEDSIFDQPLNNWDVSNVTDMSYMFYNTPFDQPINNWDVSNVKDMSYMFSRADSFNQPINNWDVSSVINFNNMIGSSFNQPLDNWDVSNGRFFVGMFAFNDVFNQPLNNWDLSNAEIIFGMFFLNTVFDQPLNNWNVSNVTNMNNMFQGASSFNQPLDNWNVSNVTLMSSMFKDATNFNQDISSWCVEQFTGEPSGFSINAPLQDSFKPNWGAICNISNPEFILDEDNTTCLCPDADFGDFGTIMINGELNTFTKRSENALRSLVNTDINNQQIALTCTSDVTDMSELFKNKTDFNQTLEHWDVSNVTDMSSMFENATSFNIPTDEADANLMSNSSSSNLLLSQWDVSNVLNMDAMFKNATQFNQDISDWCVEQIPTEPVEFSLNSSLQDSFKPNWGAICTLSIQDNNLLNFNVYPNPTQSKVFIENQNSINIDQIKIINILGQVVKKKNNINQKQTNIDLSELASGTYFIQISSKDTQQIIKRIIKK